jgi:cytochrome c oxidase subunit 1
VLIAVPTGVKIFNWIGTLWRGSVTFETPMVFSLGFLVSFVFGGLTGVILASPPLDFHLSDSYFVVAHFHYVVFGTVVFAMFAGFYFWWPKWTGRMLNERLGMVHFWMLFIGFHMTFLIQHWLGVDGMVRRCGRLRGGRLDLGEPGVHDRRDDPGCLDDPVLPERLDHRAQGAEGHGQRPLGLRRIARVGHQLPAAASQLHVDPAHSQRAPCLRPQPPEAALPVGVGPAKDAPDAPVVDTPRKIK